MTFDLFLSPHSWKQFWAWDVTFFLKSFVFPTLNNNPSPSLRTHLSETRACCEQRTALRFDKAGFLQTKAMLTSDNMHLKPVCEYVQGVTLVSLLRCRFCQLMLIASQRQGTFDQLPGKKKTGGTPGLFPSGHRDTGWSVSLRDSLEPCKRP